jgi:succinate-semialdehyde dehydrogenase / glutarate-semialdehyde dehydrogenase
MSIQTINPATGEVLNTYRKHSNEEVDRLLENAHQAFLAWRQTAFSERSRKMMRAAELLRARKEKYAELIAREMGKPLTLGLYEVEKCASWCQHFAEHAEAMLAPHKVETEMTRSYVTYQPLGIVFAIMPWNFPFLQVFRFAASGLMAGNGYILKHAPNTTGCGLAIVELFKDAGFPDFLFNAVVIDVDQSENIIANRFVAGVTFTGSVGAGRKVGALASQYIKKVVLELGGNDPYLILEDADLDNAAAECVNSRLPNAGQVCISAKRLIVVDAVRERFQEKVIALAKRFKAGNPLLADTTLGPIARGDLRDVIDRQVKESLAQGAERVMGGKPDGGPGFFYPITILRNLKPGMPAYDDEIFGPVISFIDAKDEADAIAIANSSALGLTSAVFTADTARGERVALAMEAGACYVNAHVVSDARLPLGGIKNSGFGRELSEIGIREFTNAKTICIK